jgi:hypothetical protein
VCFSAALVKRRTFDRSDDVKKKKGQEKKKARNKNPKNKTKMFFDFLFFFKRGPEKSAARVAMTATRPPPF